AANAKWNEVDNMGVILTNEAGENSWPITAASFILLHKLADKPASTKGVLDFFAWAFSQGQEAASELDYVPL
ncbi:phosphate ABC transporter substrate-binding protein PstS, partial [Avibacterium avium]